MSNRIASTILPTRRRPVPPAAIALTPKPWTVDTIERLHVLADRLAGRPVPGLRMDEADFIDWCDPEVKADWLDGEVVLMSPEGWENASFLTWMTRLLGDHVEAHDLGVLLGREMLVRLPGQRRLRGPDMQFIAKGRTDIITPTLVDGAPDLVIEAVSPSSIARDWRVKYGEYEKAGIREYWVFDPIAKHVEAYALQKNKRYDVIPEVDGKIVSGVIKGFHVRPKWITAAKLPRVANVLRELSAKKKSGR